MQFFGTTIFVYRLAGLETGPEVIDFLEILGFLEVLEVLDIQRLMYDMEIWCEAPDASALGQSIVCEGADTVAFLNAPTSGIFITDLVGRFFKTGDAQ